MAKTKQLTPEEIMTSFSGLPLEQQVKLLNDIYRFMAEQQQEALQRIELLKSINNGK